MVQPLVEPAAVGADEQRRAALTPRPSALAVWSGHPAHASARASAICVSGCQSCATHARSGTAKRRNVRRGAAWPLIDDRRPLVDWHRSGRHAWCSETRSRGAPEPTLAGAGLSFRPPNCASKASAGVTPACCGLDLEGQPKPRSGMSSIQQQRSRSLPKKTPFRGVMPGDDRNGEHQKIGKPKP